MFIFSGVYFKLLFIQSIFKNLLLLVISAVKRMYKISPSTPLICLMPENILDFYIESSINKFLEDLVRF